MKSSLDLLADAATSPLASYDSHDYNSSSSPTPSPVLLRRSPHYNYRDASPSASSCSHQSSESGSNTNGAHQLRPRKKAHKSPKHPRVQLKPSPEMKMRRKELMDRASGIDSLSNSPANDCQLHVLRTVFDEITMYPTEPWLALMAVILRRSLRQIKNWFSNERQKNRWGDVVSTFTDVGERLRLRPAAIELCELWSDSFFEEVLMIINFRTIRHQRWDRCKIIVDESGSDSSLGEDGSDDLHEF
ncbi:hypothetical protein R3P38DRAFT_2824068 [Favolaschia claudopus]|uniref:Homeobox domain-containing protein n=1 Tax=Favolaschia claudopus TaxID=2862362 RepID=A0AAW0EII0_9AGAR